MSNFIAKFLDDKLKEKNKNTKSFVDENKLKNEEKNVSLDKKQDNENKNNISSLNKKQNKNESKKRVDKNNKKVKNDKYINDIQNIWKWVNKELSWYLWNDFNLDNTMKNMSIKEMSNDLNKESNNKKTIKKSKKDIIKIQKQKPYKNLLYIFIEFLIWIILIWISVVNINGNIAETKFMNSSIDLWTNTFNWIATKFKGIIWNNAREGYIKKRQDLVSDLKTYEDKLKSCNKKWKDKMKNRLINLKEQLKNTNYITLDKFIKNYEEYHLDVNAMKDSVNDLCK